MKGPDNVAMADEKTRGQRSRRSFPQIGLVLSTVLLFLAARAEASERELVLIPDPILLPLMILLFAALIVPVNTLLFKPIFRVIEDRGEKINGTLTRANRLGEEAADLLARYDTAIREVRDEAESERKRSFSDARLLGASEIDRARAAADREIESARGEVTGILEDARAILRTKAEELAGQAAERVLGRRLS